MNRKDMDLTTPALEIKYHCRELADRMLLIHYMHGQTMEYHVEAATDEIPLLITKLEKALGEFKKWIALNS